MAPRRKIVTKRKKKQIAQINLRLCTLYMMWQLNQVNREYWVHPLNVERSRKGEFFTHYADHRNYPERFFELYRMSIPKFDELLYKVTLYMQKKELNLRETISPEQRLVITIR